MPVKIHSLETCQLMLEKLYYQRKWANSHSILLWKTALSQSFQEMSRKFQIWLISLKKSKKIERKPEMKKLEKLKRTTCPEILWKGSA